MAFKLMIFKVKKLGREKTLEIIFFQHVCSILFFQTGTCIAFPMLAFVPYPYARIIE